MSIKGKMQKEDEFSSAQNLKLYNFHNFVRFLYNFSTFTLLLNDDATAKDKEEVVIAQMLAFELSNTFGDKIMFPSVKNEFMLKVQEVWKHNFLIPNISPPLIKSLVYGNFHELQKQPSSFVYKKYSSEEFKSMAKELSKGLKLDSEKSWGYLQAYLESPGVLRHVYKISRLLVTKNSHIILVGPPRACGREILQLATLIYPDTFLYEPEVKISDDIIGFKESFRSAMIQAVKTDKDIVFYYDTNHIDDPVYVNYMSNFMKLFDRDSIETFDREFCDQLISAQKEYMELQIVQFPNSKNLKLKKPVQKVGAGSSHGLSKDIYSFENGKRAELSEAEYYSLALAKISGRFHIVIQSSGIRDYKELNRYNCLESTMSVIFLEDIVNEDWSFFTQEDAESTAKTNFNMFDISYEFFTKMQLQNPAPKNNQEAFQDTELEVDRKNKQLAKRMIEIKSKIHNSILDFYKTITVEDPDQQIAPGLAASIIPSEDMRLEIIAGLVCKTVRESPHLDIPVSVNYNSKFVILHEMIKFMHDFLSTSLMIRVNYYESLVEKTKDLTEFYESTVIRKKDLHGKNHTVTVQMLDYQEQISRVESQLEDIQASINNNIQRRKQQEELEKELSKVISEKDRRINKIVSLIEQTTGADYEFM